MTHYIPYIILGSWAILSSLVVAVSIYINLRNVKINKNQWNGFF